MLEKYIDEQFIATTLLKKSLKQDKLVQAYLFYSNDIEYIFKYAKEFSKEIVCDKNDINYENTCYKIDKEIYTELKIIEPITNYIKKEQLLSLQNETMNKPIEGRKIVYIIKNCEKLNLSAANSILKFLEEPNEDIIAILLTNNINLVIPTIKSRCQIVNFKSIDNKLETKDTYSILNNIINKNDTTLSEEEFINIVDSTIEFLKLIESRKINCLINVKKILWDKFIDINRFNIFLDILIYLYFDVLYKKIDKNIKYSYNFEKVIDDICNNEINDIIKKISIIENIKQESFYNVNLKLLFDKLIIELSDVNG